MIFNCLLFLFPVIVNSSRGTWVARDVRRFEDTLNQLGQVEQEVRQSDANIDEKDRPYINGIPVRQDRCPLGKLDHISQIFQTMYGKVLLSEILPEENSGTDSSPVVTKYLSDCFARIRSPSPNRVRHPLIVEYTIMKIINDLNISPKVFYLSPPAPLPQTEVESMQSAPFMGSALYKQYARCARLGSQVRYIVQEKVGPNLLQYYSALETVSPDLFNSSQFSLQLIKITREVIRHLKTLHGKGFIHGDIHNGNVCFRSNSQRVGITNSDIVLIDFDQAKFFPSKIGLSPKLSTFPSHLSPDPMSIWQLQGARPGPRDDIYRAILVLAKLLSRGRLTKGIKRMFESNLELRSNPQSGTSEYLKLRTEVNLYAKSNLRLFEHDIALGSEAVIGLDPPRRSAQVVSLLVDLETHIKESYPHPDSKIDYHYIEQKFEEIISLF